MIVLPYNWNIEYQKKKFISKVALTELIMKRYLPTPKSHHAGRHSRPQRPRSFWSAPRIATSGQVQQRKSAIHELPVTLRMIRVKSDKSDWLWSQSIVFTNPFKTRMSLDLARGRDSWC